MKRWIEYMYSFKITFSVQRYSTQPGFCVDFLKQKFKPAFVTSVF